MLFYRILINKKNFNYEVETRFFFKEKKDILYCFPQLKGLLFRQIRWKTSIIGEKLFLKDKQLRISEVIYKNETFNYLGYKEKDIGTFCNIRKELDEKIDDINSFISTSNIIRVLSLPYKKHKRNFNSIDDFFASYNIYKFLYFEGESEISEVDLSMFINKSLINKIKRPWSEKRYLTDYENLKLNLKIMYCNYIKFPLIFEIELIANNKWKAFFFEKIIKEIVYDYNISNIVIRKEPPFLLYETKNRIS